MVRRKDFLVGLQLKQRACKFVNIAETGNKHFQHRAFQTSFKRAFVYPIKIETNPKISKVEETRIKVNV